MENIESKKIMINCKEATFLYSKSLETKLHFANKFRLKIHLMMCKHCRHFSHQVKEIETIVQKETQFYEKEIEYYLSDNQKVEIKNELEQEKDN